MRHHLIYLLMFVGHFAWSATSNAENEEPAKKPDTEATVRNVDEIFKRLDLNGDGSISIAEVPKTGQSLVRVLLKRAGKSDSATLTRAQFEQLIQQNTTTGTGPKKRSAPIDWSRVRFAEMIDRDNDGLLSIEELPAIRTKFDELDANRDGRLSPSELLVGIRPEAKTETAGTDDSAAIVAQRLFRERLDKNGDGKLSPEESPGYVRDNFAMFDQDGNSFIDANEFERYYKESLIKKP